MIGIVVYGFVMRYLPKITSITIENDKISQDMNIVFISDLHVEYTRGTKYIQSLVDQIKQLNPDFVLIGWDLVNIAKTSYVPAF